MRRLLTSSIALAAALGAYSAAPAAATCMEHFDRAGVRIYSCAAPGGPVTTYYCVHDTCVSNP
ncbi:MAG TPA: hypothetical protein VNA20_16845 [Frankiaceae bacterium]|nr:hypothetical protein [Frankiaceae bacterium]